MRTYAVVDLETTGNNPAVHEIIEIAVVKIVDGVVSDEFTTLVRPSGPIPFFIQRLTGITDQMVEEAPEVREVLSHFWQFVGDTVLVAHNAAFDLGFLGKYSVTGVTNKVLDTLELSRILLPTLTSHRLVDLVKYYRISVEGLHRALKDARVTADIFLKLLQEAEELPLPVLDLINQTLANEEAELREVFRQAYRKAAGQFPPMPVRGSEKKYLFFSSEKATDEFPFESTRQTNERYFLPDEELAELLRPGGLMAEKFPAYEYRQQQEEMLLAISRAFNQKKHLVVEAGTGTGKSLAYLIPAAVWAVNTGERVVVATHTINLQEQLLEKDIPVLKDVLSLPVEAALVKGRNNYLCLHKWEALGEEMGKLPWEEKVFFLSLAVWLSRTSSGDRGEIGLEQNKLWQQVGADSASCLGPECHWYKHWCFVTRARRKAEKADLLVVNHSVMLSDIEADTRFLPDYRYLIIDEAHHLEDAATEQLGVTLRLSEILSRLSEVAKNLYALKRVKLKDNPSQKELENGRDTGPITACLEEATKQGENLAKALNQLFAHLKELCLKYSPDKGSAFWNYQLRITQKIRAVPLWSLVRESCETVTLNLRKMDKLLRELTAYLEKTDNISDRVSARKFAPCLTLGSQLCREIEDKINLCLADEDREYVCWIEAPVHGEEETTLRSAPVNVGPLLAEKIYRTKDTVIFTAATLCVGGSFDYFMSRVGLDLLAGRERERVETLKLDSPFDYSRQVLLCVVKDLPPPAAVLEDSYMVAISQLLIDIFTATKGRGLALFTSHQMLRKCYFMIKEKLEERGVGVLGHNIDGSRWRLIEKMTADPQTVILGSSSFWEGVDLPGSLLRCVVIVKLPFMSPTLPTVAARLEALERQRINSFYNYSLPQAIIRLQQGFGRLIRRKNDHGAVVILDQRILSKGYGKKLLESLPLRDYYLCDRASVGHTVGSWIKKKEKN
ncbi:DNA polymerase III subunit epsilon [Calderihabitans maritimus]|uniref:3'-5' exonuclease DinG n=2 Tax=Calderihabitans maritimus TaxID=1246530 RepID=A0A1Z5HY86_9FIRM|nr:DNA polymerase III subunit epsilon [Calderihabitans maritimus]